MKNENIKIGNTISYKEMVNYLIENFKGEGFDENIIKRINTIPKNKFKIKEKLLKISRLKIKNPYGFYPRYNDNSSCITFYNGKVSAAQFILLSDNVRVDAIIS